MRGKELIGLMTTRGPPGLSKQGRLQRNPDFTGDRLSTFGDVLVRHGLPGLLLACLSLFLADVRILVWVGLEPGLSQPATYLLAVAFIFAALTGYACFIDRKWSLSSLGWVGYLGALSLWEELVFRLAMPGLLEGWGAPFWLAAVVSGAAFGGMHYFTLRWRLRWCFGAFLCSLALSSHFNLHIDLLLITAFHWIATVLNTPRPPGKSVVF